MAKDPEKALGGSQKSPPTLSPPSSVSSLSLSEPRDNTRPSAGAQLHDVESHRSTSGARKNSFFGILLDQAGVTDEVLHHPYAGDGTPESPYLVDFLPNDRRNALTLQTWFKWVITGLQAIACLSVAFASSVYTGATEQIIDEFGISDEVAILGLSTFIIGFAVGPLFWAPLSEMYGRQKTFFWSYVGLAAFNAGTAAAANASALIILRFLAGACGSSPLTNAGGVIADMFVAAERGTALCLFTMAPFLGPAIGPIVGGFLGEAAGWRWVLGLSAIFAGVLWIICSLSCPETYTPVLLRRRAEALSQRTGKAYISKLEAGKPKKSLGGQLKVSLSRPWVLLFFEPIVLLLTLYIAIIYGTLYMFFAAFPIVYQQQRGWSAGIGGLPFIGLACGMVSGGMICMWDNRRYARLSRAHHGFAPPESRLPPAILGSLLLPVGMFWFAWTNGPSVHWIVSIIGAGVFGVGIVLMFLPTANYLIDSYVIYAASALAANAVLRSLFGGIFPLFTTYMYDSLGVHWASSIPAFLCLACVPFPYLFYKHGKAIRLKCRYSAEAAEVLQVMRTNSQVSKS